MTAADLRTAWFTAAGALHMPAYSLLTEPLGLAAAEAVRLARDAGARVSLDLASVAPLLAGGRRTARGLLERVAPDVLFATADEAASIVGNLEGDVVLVVGEGDRGL